MARKTPTDDRPLAVRPATPDDWPAVELLLGRDGERGCWCQYWRLSASDYSARPLGEGARLMRRQLADEPAPGIVAYRGDEPAGWLGLWPRQRFERLNRSRTIPQVDDVAVWSIVCFYIRVGYRRQGVARGLLEGAIDYARRCGAPALEAYPIDPAGQRADVAFGYVGFLPMFERAGFRAITETAARSDGRPRILVRRDLR
ncbi:MAG TPA: GNAT family N-acetyltransferase [Candidatus Limnocylindrales bacterium]|jgi:GNAT superfamily N-acetyltransferase